MATAPATPITKALGKKVYQTLYFGKRPSCVRIYDKVAERMRLRLISRN
jgi:hypothetical protein